MKLTDLMNNLLSKGKVVKYKSHEKIRGKC